VKYYTDDYPKPNRHSGPFNMAHSLKYHGQAKTFLDREEHQGEEFWNDLKAGKQTCFDCHGRATDAAEETLGVAVRRGRRRAVRRSGIAQRR